MLDQNEAWTCICSEFINNFGCSGYLYLQVFFVLIFRLLHLSKPGTTSTGVVSTAAAAASLMSDAGVTT